MMPLDSLPSLYGLVLAGGHSRRMGTDKAELSYRPDGYPQWLTTVRLLTPFVEKVYLSIRSDQILREADALTPDQLLPDDADSEGPISGILTAMNHHPDAAWLVVACDLPLLTAPVIECLIQDRGSANALAFRSAFDGLPEPLCTLYEPPMKSVFERSLAADTRCPRKVLIDQSEEVKLLDLPQTNALENANTPEDYARLRKWVKAASPK